MAFEFNAQQYITASDHQLLWGQQLVNELKLQGHESILDLGCGDGRLTALLALQVPQGSVVGIDASQQMTAAARQRHRHIRNLSFRTLNINHLCSENEFDVIFSNAALHWVPNHDQLMQRVRRALKPGARIRFNFAGSGNCVHLIDTLQQTLATPEFAPLFDRFTWPWTMPTVEETDHVVRSAGFRDVRVWNRCEETRFPDAQPLIGWIDHPCLVPFISVLKNLDQQRRFRQRVVQQMIDRTRQPNGSYLETFQRINVKAHKGVPA